MDWAKAPKLTVRVEHPALWGVSNPTGNITPAKDIRKGYAFEIEFTPDLAYSLEGWRAYLTSSLPADWLLDPGLLDGVERLDGVSVIVPELPARGGIGKFIINTTENVTLVPWCKTEPYVLRTVPRNSPAILYPRGTTIEIFFNAPLLLTPNEELPLLFTEGIIKITAKGINKEDEPVLISGNNYSYNYPIYTANNDLGEYKITITPTNVPGDSLVEVTVGPNILNASNTPMAKSEVFSFNTYPASGGGSIDTWSADYNESAKTIEIKWTTTGAVFVEAHYRVNKSADNELSGGSPVMIRGVSALNNSSVREGREVSNIQEYEIFLDLIVEGLKSNVGSKSFKIWNIPGMSVAHNNPILEINTEAALAAIRTPATDNLYYGLGAANAAKQYVLTDDITITTAWTPIGTDTDSFQGKFYGNGHAVSIVNFAVPSDGTADIGLFGVVGGGFIRDFTVQHSGSVTRSGETRFGGIAGTMKGTAKTENVLVKGVVTVTVDTDNDMYVGGITGRMLGTTETTNSYGGLDLIVNHPYIYTVEIEYFVGGSVYVGGITGSMGIDDAGITVKVEKVTVVGNINITASSCNAEDLSQNYGLIIGGLAGQVIHANMNDTYYQQGDIIVNSNYGSAFLGGAFGYVENSIISNCYSAARKFNTIKEKYGNSFYVGGFMGQSANGGVVVNCYSVNSITVEANKLNNSSSIGGFVGYCNSDIIYCYSKADVNTYVTIGEIGGFVGSGGYKKSFKYCYASGNINALNSSNNNILSVGGFIGFSDSCIIANCYYQGNVFIDSNNNNYVDAGGLLGGGVGNPIEHNFSMGAVTIWNSTGSTSVGGISSSVSYIDTFQNNVALCASIMVTGSGTKNIGRITGSVLSGSPSNYAYSDMMLSTRTSHNASWTSFPTTAGAATKDGADAHDGNFRDPAFWKGLGFSEEDWIFSTTVGMRHPILRASKNGPEMGGQR